MLTVIGSYLSPYVRKVLMALHHKGLAYQIDPIVPFYGNETFERLSPLRRVPLLLDGDLVVNDSSVICAYLDERYPDPPLLPASPAQRAQARWLEEFADARLGEVVTWHLFNQLVIRRFVWGEPPDAAAVAKARDVELPRALDYLETQWPPSGFLFGELGLADMAVAAFFRNAEFVQWRIDAERWPRSATWVRAVLEHPVASRLRRYEDLCLRTPIPRHRQALLEAGAPIAGVTYGVDKPRRGLMKID